MSSPPFFTSITCSSLIEGVDELEMTLEDDDAKTRRTITMSRLAVVFFKSLVHPLLFSARCLLLPYLITLLVSWYTPIVGDVFYLFRRNTSDHCPSSNVIPNDGASSDHRPFSYGYRWKDCDVGAYTCAGLYRRTLKLVLLLHHIEVVR